MAPFVALEKGGTRESLVAHVTWETPISHVNVPFMFFLCAFARKLLRTVTAFSGALPSTMGIGNVKVQFRLLRVGFLTMVAVESLSGGPEIMLLLSK